jgi:RHS repeat-associated protein
VRSAGDNLYSYDDNGNMLSGAGRTITWDGDNRVVSINGDYFAYDPSGERIKKIENGRTTLYLADAEITDGKVVHAFNLNGQKIAKRTGNVIAWLYTDHQGTVQAVEDSAGQMQRQSFRPYGTRATSVVDSVGYTGEQRDASGLIYLGSRYYDPALGRFISPDTVVPSSFAVGLNRYAYGYNTPTMYSDPDGRNPLLFLFAMAGAQTVGELAAWFGLGVATTAVMTYDALHAADHQTPQPYLSTPMQSVDTNPGRPADFWDNYGPYFVSGANASENAVLVAGLAQAGHFVGTKAVAALLRNTVVLEEKAAKLVVEQTVRRVEIETQQKIFGPCTLDPNAGGFIRSFVTAEDKIFYRVFSGDRRAGRFLTSSFPKSSEWARNALSLPPSNQAEFIQEVLVPAGTRVQRSRALPLNGRRGGAEQFQLLENIPDGNFRTGVKFQW